MQTTSIALYQQLLPGIGNVTVRMRYYGFYTWLADTYAKEVGSIDVERWCIYVRRVEALYALAAIHITGETGVAGAEWTTAKLSDSDAEIIEFHLNTDREGDHRQYLKQKFGVFGAAYGAQLVEIGLLEYLKYSHEIPVPTLGAASKVVPFGCLFRRYFLVESDCSTQCSPPIFHQFRISPS
ncbi:hypothetical protein [Rhodoferax sp.]|uniref:hypothetical protein n=1 Tax=Rhodoferax sp. TaxID=50421 RepID=UPI001EB26A92|nr:hypothetical protein [Rhodoferax sp.]MBT9505035.1 hypothetical protein [Rhodoferax sp.]